MKKNYQIELYNDLILVRHADSVIDLELPNNLLPLTEVRKDSGFKCFRTTKR